MSFPNRSRRVGDRLAVQGIVLGWNTKGRRTPRWKRQPFAEADVIDVSVSGASVLAPDDRSILLNQKVTVTAGGALGEVRVRRIVPVSNGQTAVFGVEFVSLEEPLEALLYSRLGSLGPRPDDIVWR